MPALQAHGAAAARPPSPPPAYLAPAPPLSSPPWLQPQPTPPPQFYQHPGTPTAYPPPLSPPPPAHLYHSQQPQQQAQLQLPSLPQHPLQQPPLEQRPSWTPSYAPQTWAPMRTPVSVADHTPVSLEPDLSSARRRSSKRLHKFLPPVRLCGAPRALSGSLLAQLRAAPR